ncbi:MAG: LacI family DNA-binding transcriptional regulator [Planctomycetota bacterium]
MTSTISQVAEQAGVSIGTVSRVLNGKNKENRPSAVKRAAKIRKIAAEIGYRPNTAARAARSGAFGAFGLLACSDPLSESLDLGLIHGIQSGLGRGGERLLMSELPPTGFQNADTIPQILTENSVDGLIVSYVGELPESWSQMIESGAAPHIWLNTKAPKNCVYPDDFQAARDATRYLVSLGHERLAFLSQHEHEVTGFRHYSVFDRRDGFLAALDDAGLKPLAVEVTGGFVFGHGAETVTRILKQPERPTALVCYEKHEAVLAWVAATALGLRIPEDLSIIAFHPDMLRKQTGLPIRTVVVPFATIGQVAVEMLRAATRTRDRVLPARAIPYSMDDSRSCAPPLSPADGS